MWGVTTYTDPGNMDIGGVGVATLRLGGVTSYTDIGNMDTGGGGGQIGWGECGGVSEAPSNASPGNGCFLFGSISTLLYMANPQH